MESSDLPESWGGINVESANDREAQPRKRSQSGKPRRRGLDGESASPPAPVPLSSIPLPPPSQMPSDGLPPPPSDRAGGGRSRAWMLANLRNGGPTIVASSPQTASEDGTSTAAAPQMNLTYPVEDGNDVSGAAEGKKKKMKKVKKTSSSKRGASPSTATEATAVTPSTVQHYVDTDDGLTSPDELLKMTPSVVEVVDQAAFEDTTRARKTRQTTGRQEASSDDADSDDNSQTDRADRRKSHRTALDVGVAVMREDEDRADTRRPPSAGRPRTSTGVPADFRDRAGPGRGGAGTLEFYALPRLMRLQQTFEAQRGNIYNFCATHVLEWPTMAVEWIPDRRFADPERDYTLQYVAVGTQAGRGQQNTVRVMEVAVPVYFNTGAMYSLFGDDDIDGAAGATTEEFEAMVDPGKLFRNIRGHFNTDQVVSVDSPVLKIKAMPAENNTVAVKTASGLIKIYNLVRDLQDDANGLTTPEATLLGHTTGGFGLCWNPVKLGYVVSGSDDGYVNYWDISHLLTAGLDADAIAAQQHQQSHIPDLMGTESQPIQRLTGHRDIITDVSCHHAQGHLIASSSMDGDVRIWDTRSNASSNMTIPEAHEGGATAAQFHPLGDFQIATAGTDGSVGLWDIRHSRREVTSLAYHGKSVTGVQWSPFKETVFTSFGEDGRVVVWDLSKTTLPMSYSEDAMAPPEVAFVHIGHLGRVTDCSWSSGKDDEWLMASADTMNGLHFYQPRIDVVEDYRVDKKFMGMRR